MRDSTDRYGGGGAFVVGALATLLVALAVGPAVACTTCGCGLPGSASEVTNVSNSEILFGDHGQFLVQTSMSVRDITGSFNDRGTWNAKPTGSSLVTVSAGMGISYFPSPVWTLGLQVPFAGNRLVGAQWAAQGAINPLDDENGPVAPQLGGGLSDVTLQASYEAYREDDTWPSLSVWSGLMLPTGASSGDAAGFTGSGAFNGQVGLSVFRTLGNYEVFLNVGYQRPLWQASTAVQDTFYVGQAVMAQAQVGWNVTPAWKLGLSALGIRGWISDPSVAPSASTVGKLQLVPSVEWHFLEDQSLKLSVGGDPGVGPWLNAMTDQTLSLVYSRSF